MRAPASLAATTTAGRSAVEIHHRVPRCLLRLWDAADDHTNLDGAAIQAWLEFELEALRFGVDPDVTRDDLAAMIDASAVELPAADHRGGHAADFRRWGRRGGLATARRYGTAWFSLLARRRWNRISAEALAETFTVMNGGRS